MLSGGSTVSTSLIPLASTVTEQIVPSGRLPVGSSVIDDVPQPLGAQVCALLPYTTVIRFLVTSTGSLKFTVMFVFAATSVAPSAGDVVVTAGAESVVKEKL